MVQNRVLFLLKLFQSVLLPIILVLYVNTNFRQQTIAEESRKPAPILVVCFAPSDCNFNPDCEERLNRVMENIRTFYQKEMERNGYGPMTFELERQSDGKLNIHYLHGAKKQSEYTRADSSSIREEVRAGLEKEGISSDGRYVVIFQLLLKQEGDRSIELGPYVGGGTHLSGTAWVFEDTRLDAALLTSKQPGGWYHRPCSLGKFNSIYIGGVAHEMGHMFGLPHEKETIQQQTKLGRSLMGSGNQTYGDSLREEGPGSFLSLAAAMRLVRCRAFAGEFPFNQTRPSWDINELSARFDGKGNNTQLIISGNVSTNMPLIGLIAYNDNTTIKDEYDATSWTTTPKTDGSFEIVVKELVKTSYRLKLVGVHCNGATSSISISYKVSDPLLQSDLIEINSYVAEQKLRRFFNSWNVDKMEELRAEFKRSENISPILLRKMEHLYRLMTVPIDRKKPELVDTNIKTFDLSDAIFEKEQTGWERPIKRIVPQTDLFIMIGGQFYDSGLFAHAPSYYQVKTGKKWTRFRFGYGLQDGHSGSVIFRVCGDGLELFRSPLIEDAQIHRTILDIKNVDTLELYVDPGDDGKSYDWGIWVDPVLER